MSYDYYNKEDFEELGTGLTGNLITDVLDYIRKSTPVPEKNGFPTPDTREEIIEILERISKEGQNRLPRPNRGRGRS